jgi:hypothetical protein
MHLVGGVRHPAVSFPLPLPADDLGERRQANRAVIVSAIGLTITGLVELAIAILTGSVGLLGDAFHNLSDVSTSALVFLGFRASRKAATDRYSYGFEASTTLQRRPRHRCRGQLQRALLHADEGLRNRCSLVVSARPLKGTARPRHR